MKRSQSDELELVEFNGFSFVKLPEDFAQIPAFCCCDGVHKAMDCDGNIVDDAAISSFMTEFDRTLILESIARESQQVILLTLILNRKYRAISLLMSQLRKYQE